MPDPIDFSVITLSSVMPTSLREVVYAQAEIRDYAAGDMIEIRGTLATHVSWIKLGMVRLGVDNADGSRFNMSLLNEGNSFGELALFLNQPTRHDAQAETDVTLARISKQGIDKLIATEPEFAHAMLKVAYSRFETTLVYLGDSINFSVEQRAAKLILDMSKRTGNSNEIVCRQIDLSHALGVSRVSIGKALKSLAKRKLIEVGYGKIKVNSRSGLKQMCTSKTEDSEQSF